MKRRYQTLLDKSIAAMRAAIDIVNRPKYGYREEVFVILCVNAWELLIKAKWLKDHNGKISCLYVEENIKNKKTGVTRKKYKKTRSKNPMTHELSYLIRHLNANNAVIESNVVNNIESLIEARDNAIHFFTHTARIDTMIREIGLASIKNYVEIVEEWFDDKLEEFGFCLVPVSVVDVPTAITSLIGNQAEKRFVEYLSSVIEKQDQSSSKSVAIILDVKFSKASEFSNLKFQLVSDSENKISLSEEEQLKLYPFDYKEVVSKLKARYSNFSKNKMFNKLMQEVKKDTSLHMVRFLNPKKKKTSQDFYSSNIFNFFDKHYEKK
ncbi:MAG: DUF3644 domain-containing protein [Planctomycetaceae bacterium]|jgi:hypothetical protein|nr:DUF3644 domain-containing protein [Planctomycetaceae bacterium]